MIIFYSYHIPVKLITGQVATLTFIFVPTPFYINRTVQCKTYVFLQSASANSLITLIGLDLF